MKCPVDDETLLMTQRDGVEIDYCPKCRGVWLDRGELDKIIEKSIGAATPAVQLTPPPEAQPAAFNQAPPPPPPWRPPWPTTGRRRHERRAAGGQARGHDLA